MLIRVLYVMNCLWFWTMNVPKNSLILADLPILAPNGKSRKEPYKHAVKFGF